MPFVPHTEEDRRRMLDVLGLDSEEELFDPVPRRFLLSRPPGPQKGMTEFEVRARFENLGAKNEPAGEMVSFLGGGVYDHAVPAAVDHLAQRSEFYTAYTPYQAEVSQGTLQAIFEFQTMVARLTALPVANASMYDGATALAEAALMAVRVTKRSKIVYPQGLNPRYTRVLSTYLRGQGLELVGIPFAGEGTVDEGALSASLSAETAAVIVQSPNFFGLLERPWRFSAEVESTGAMLIACVDPVSLAVIRPPGSYGAHIAVGEGQCLGNHMNFGGPLVGFMACRQELMRKMPGRIVSRTTDRQGREAYVLTLQTREQHIRRERATSNICTNEGLLALRATIYLALLGERGFRELGLILSSRSRRLATKLAAIPGFALAFSAPFFREFPLKCPCSAEEIARAGRKEGILPGIPLGRYYGSEFEETLLVAVTEKRSEEDLDRLARFLAKFSS